MEYSSNAQVKTDLLDREYTDKLLKDFEESNPKFTQLFLSEFCVKIIEEQYIPNLKSVNYMLHTSSAQYSIDI
jgi:hypothetical protein